MQYIRISLKKTDLTEKQYWTIREVVIYAILSTDVENHFALIGAYMI